MKPWIERTKEEANLLNPAFCSVVLSSAITGYHTIESKGMPYPLTFIVLPVVLHKPTRETLPHNVRTSLAAWVQDNAFARVAFYERVTSLMPFVKESVLFGLLNDLLELGSFGQIKSKHSESNIARMLRKTSGEPNKCIRRAQFVGRWFASAGSVETVMALWGIRP